MSVRIGAISVCSSLRMQEVRPSGPAALPGFNLDSCFSTSLTDTVISALLEKKGTWDLRSYSSKGVSL